jgi:IclR helix-turn-helix domain
MIFVFVDTCKSVPDTWYSGLVGEWSFLTKHAAVLLCIAEDPGVRLRDIAAAVDITERTAHGIVVDLTESGYVVKTREGRRNRYQVQPDLPLHTPVGRERPVGDVLALLTNRSKTRRSKNRA